MGGNGLFAVSRSRTMTAESRVWSICLEITDRKRAEYALLESERLLESEKRFRSLFEHMLDGVAYCRML